MIWNSLSDFLAMGGYALYVWGSLSVVIVSIAGELWELRRRRKAVLSELFQTRVLRAKSPRTGA